MKEIQKHLSPKKYVKVGLKATISEINTFKFLHKDNVILFKNYNEDLDLYSTLVIHMNGDIECIIENNYKLMNEDIIKILINDCNKLIEELNDGEFYSFELINTFEKDIFENQYLDTKLDFLNCASSFDNKLFEKKKNISLNGINGLLPL